MSREFTTEQLTQAIRDLVTARCVGVDPEGLNVRFCPTLVECDGPGRTALLSIRTYRWMSNPIGMTHGGMVTAILDSSMGILCAAQYGVITPTITMTTNYLRPVPLDRELHIRVRCTYPGGGSAQLNAEMYLAGDLTSPLATASGVYYTAHAGKQ